MNEVRRIMEAILLGELHIDRNIDKIKEYFRKFTKNLKNIPFGWNKKIVIHIPKTLTEGHGDSYTYGEYVEVLSVFKIVNKFIDGKINHINVTTNVNDSVIQKVKNKGISETDIIRGEESASLIAEAIFDEMRKIEDFLFISHIEVQRTGKPGVRADITISVKKKYREDVIKTLEYSLKSMASKTFTPYSSTGTAFLKLFVDYKGKNRREWLELVKQKMGDDPFFLDLLKYLKLAAEAKKQNNENDIDTYRQAISNLMANIINKHGKDQTFIKNFLDVCGFNFDKTENIYVAVGKANNVKLYSSNSSENFKELLNKIREGVYISAEHKEKESGFSIIIVNKLGSKIDIPIRGGWGVTSSKAGTPKLNIIGNADIFN